MAGGGVGEAALLAAAISAAGSLGAAGINASSQNRNSSLPFGGPGGTSTPQKRQTELSPVPTSPESLQRFMQRFGGGQDDDRRDQTFFPPLPPPVMFMSPPPYRG